MINAVAFKVSRDIGKLYENVVFIELKRKGKEVYYWKKISECDFLVKEREKITDAIQVCYEVSKENKKREINGLVEAMDEFKLNEGLIITNDFEGEEVVEGKKIIYTPLWKWLLQ